MHWHAPGYHQRTRSDKHYCSPGPWGGQASRSSSWSWACAVCHASSCPMGMRHSHPGVVPCSRLRQLLCSSCLHAVGDVTFGYVESSKSTEWHAHTVFEMYSEIKASSEAQPERPLSNFKYFHCKKNGKTLHKFSDSRSNENDDWSSQLVALNSYVRKMQKQTFFFPQEKENGKNINKP